MIANDNRTKGRTVDYTKTLEFLAHNLLTPDCQVVLDERQFEVLKRYLEAISEIGEGANFQLERCVDYRDHASSAGYSVAWDDDGTRLQNDLIDAIMADMVQNLGLVGGSILNEGYITDLADIDGRIAEIRDRVRSRHGLE